MAKAKELTGKQRDGLLNTLRARFEGHMQRHTDLEWSAVRRGYGRALLETAEEWLFAAGWETIWLETGQEPHFRAHSFYQSAGWRFIRPADHGDVRYEKRRDD